MQTRFFQKPSKKDASRIEGRIGKIENAIDVISQKRRDLALKKSIIPSTHATSDRNDGGNAQKSQDYPNDAGGSNAKANSN